MPKDAQANAVRVCLGAVSHAHIQNAVLCVEQVPLHSRVGVTAALSSPQLSNVAAMEVKTCAASYAAAGWSLFGTEQLL